VKFEIIIVDDGSPDGTQDIVKQLRQVNGEDRVVSIFKNTALLSLYLFVSVVSICFTISYHGLMHCLWPDGMPVTAS
jgi:glycosyltransferase involved in cell wall biosynthesis